MEIGTFNTIGSGATQDDAIRPDWSTGPSGPLGYTPDVWDLVSQSNNQMTVRYSTA